MLLFAHRIQSTGNHPQSSDALKEVSGINRLCTNEDRLCRKDELGYVYIIGRRITAFADFGQH